MSYERDVLHLWSDSVDELDKCALLWQMDSPDDAPAFAVLCNDFFGPSADAEDIHPVDLPALRQAIADCRAVGDASYGALLWVARKRRRPVWTDKVVRWEDRVGHGIAALFRAAAEQPPTPHDLAALFETGQIRTDDEGRHWDDHGREYGVGETNGEMYFYRMDGGVPFEPLP